MEDTNVVQSSLLKTTGTYQGEREHMDLKGVITQKKDEVLKLAARYGARNIRVFGSIVRGEADGKSDIDFLVEMEEGRSLLDLGGLQMELETLLGFPVDVVTVRGLKPRIRDRVLREAQPV
jgi:hypothetical protein